MCMKNKGILSSIDQSGKIGINLEDLTKKVSLSPYALELLLDVALSMRVIYQQDSNYILGKIGHFLLHDKMTEVNLNFSQDICYQSMFFLQEALEKGEPSGLKVFGDGKTIYPMLQSLPEQAKKSWFDFDHFYSDHAFPAVLPHIMKLNPKHVYDIGGNTGKWAIFSAKHLPETQVTILDLPEQISVAKENIKKSGFEDRIDGIGVNVLETDIFPNQADIWWMSQFLDCFSSDQIVHILKTIHRSMNDDASVCIMDLFWDRQNFEAGALSLNASSLYFTCLANGNSRFYHSKVFYQCLNEAGFHVEEDIDGIGFGHTLLICKKR
ncbi:class I SAM-dependent methyltransferase [Gilliamella sp. B3023]|nr:class I SAM-dependent methyltransferase [Gilliamella sp. B3562]MCX8661868.1 class I SAM-dependent methyltransferase [Gilliamella sp. B2911]MCX8674530.1 class I SAM-dependent methyltransferase [Gilliamella sp. B3023]MCX8684587.1 class I SAM-dependent methyltransferase [Gilliamella sp. B2864]